MITLINDNTGLPLIGDYSDSLGLFSWFDTFDRPPQGLPSVDPR